LGLTRGGAWRAVTRAGSASGTRRPTTLSSPAGKTHTPRTSPEVLTRAYRTLSGRLLTELQSYKLTELRNEAHRSARTLRGMECWSGPPAVRQAPRDFSGRRGPAHSREGGEGSRNAQVFISP
jgi:hypothetical protein